MTRGATLERSLVVVGYTTDDVCLACLAGGRNSVKVKKKLLYAKKRKYIRAEARPSKPSILKKTLVIGQLGAILSRL